MALSQREIDDIVGYFTNRNAARQQALQPAAPSSTFVSGGARPAASPSGGKGAIPASILAASAAAKGAQRARLESPNNAGDANAGEVVNNIVKGIPIVGSWLSGLLAPEKSTIARDIMEPMGEADRPRNTSQAIINLLGTGTYAAANTAEEVGSHIAQLQKAAKAGDRVGQGANFLGALFAAPVVNGTAGLRVDIDLSNERMQKKIRDAQLQKIPYMLVVGEREAAEGKVAVRLRSGKDLGAMPLEQFIARIKNEAESRKDVAE